jgi:hypothetical protein
MPPVRRRRRRPTIYLLSNSLRALFAGRNRGHAEAQVCAPVLRKALDSARRPALPGFVGPTPAPEHPLRALGRPRRIGATRQFLGVPIAAPLIDVSVHVIESPRIRPLLADQVRIALVLRVAVAIGSAPPGVIAQPRIVECNVQRASNAKNFPVFPVGDPDWSACRVVCQKHSSSDGFAGVR